MNQFSYRVIIFDKLVYYLELQEMFKWTVCLIYGSFQFFATWNTKFAFGENPDQFQRLYLFWLRRCWRNWKVHQNIIYTIWCLVIIKKCWFSMTREIFRTVVYVEPSIIIAQRFSNGKKFKTGNNDTNFWQMCFEMFNMTNMKDQSFKLMPKRIWMVSSCTFRNKIYL